MKSAYIKANKFVLRSITYIIASETDQSCVNDDLDDLLPMVVRGLDCIEEADNDAKEKLTPSSITRIIALGYHFDISRCFSERCYKLLVGKNSNIVIESERERERIT